MKRRLLLVTSLISPVLLAICGGAILLGAVAVWLFAGQDGGPRIIRIAPLAPLATMIAEQPSADAGLSLPASEPPATMETVAAGENQPQGDNPSLAVDVAEILGFDLPQGTVNSVTQEGVATRLIIPKLNLDAPIMIAPIKNQTWQVDQLGQAVGHLEGTAPPGADSNFVLAGHVTLAEGVYGPFAGLGQLVAGDILVVYQNDRTFNYVIESRDIVDRTAVEVTYPTTSAQITLITCNNWDSQTGRYEQRLVVKGRLVP